MSKPLVSVIVPTFNSDRFLDKCLSSLEKQTYRNIEVIVVDNYSKDKTTEIAGKYGARIIKIRANRSRARNVGAEKALGDFLFFVDSDMELEPSVIAECVKKVKEACDGVIIPEISVGDGFWSKCKALEKVCYQGDDSLEAARFVKRGVFQRIGGYDPEMDAGEDWGFSQSIKKSGYEICRVSSLIKHNEGRLSLRETMLKKHHYGRALESYRRKHPVEAKRQLRLIRPAFIRNWKELARDPAHASGMIVMKTGEFTVGWLGILMAKKRNNRDVC